MVAKLFAFLFLFALVQTNHASVLKLYPSTFDSKLAQNQLVFVNFYADWCPYCQTLNPIYEQASEYFAINAPGKVLFAAVDCNEHQIMLHRHKITKYPTLKLYRFGQPVKKEYRGQRSVEALKGFILKQIEFSVKDVNESDVLDKVLDAGKKNMVGYFALASGVEYENFQKISSVLGDDCAFHVGVGEWTKQKNSAGNSLFYRAPNESTDLEYTGSLANYTDLLKWANDKCIPLIREITFENAEELAEEGLPFLILFRRDGDEASEKTFADAVNRELPDSKKLVNVLMADGNVFAHPLYHLGKSEKDLPLVAIDSFRHMHVFSSFNDLSVSGKLRQFVEDLKSGKLQREYYNGPDAPTAKPAESVFKELKPANSRYSILNRDEL